MTTRAICGAIPTVGADQSAANRRRRSANQVTDSAAMEHKFIIWDLFGRRPHEHGNAQVVSLLAKDRSIVHRAYQFAIMFGERFTNAIN